MRHVATLGALAALGLGVFSSSACVEAPELPGATAVMTLASNPLPGASMCFAFATRDAAGATTATRGTPGAAPDLDAARAAGAACATDGGATPTVVTLPCAPGAASVVTWLVGVYDATGARMEDTLDLCGAGGCVTELTCVAHTATPVELSLSIMRESHQGFFDIYFEVDDPGAVKDVCGAFRVVDGAGTLIWAEQGLCSSLYGNGHDTLSYIGFCSTEAADNVVTLWLHEPEPSGSGRPATGATPWVNPCPGSLAGDDALAWSGGCSRTVTCVENADVTIEFDLRTPAPR